MARHMPSATPTRREVDAFRSDLVRAAAGAELAVAEDPTTAQRRVVDLGFASVGDGWCVLEGAADLGEISLVSALLIGEIIRSLSAPANGRRR